MHEALGPLVDGEFVGIAGGDARLDAQLARTVTDGDFVAPPRLGRAGGGAEHGDDREHPGDEHVHTI